MRKLILVLVALALLVGTVAMAASPPSNSGSAIITATWSAEEGCTGQANVMTSPSTCDEEGSTQEVAALAAGDEEGRTEESSTQEGWAVVPFAGAAGAVGYKFEMTLTPDAQNATGTYCATANPTEPTLGTGTGMTALTPTTFKAIGTYCMTATALRLTHDEYGPPQGVVAANLSWCAGNPLVC